jgi:hypothetical protein
LLSQAGVISGIPIKVGTYAFTLSIFDRTATSARTGTAVMSLTISATHAFGQASRVVNSSPNG